jgi:hypothetical protein
LGAFQLGISGYSNGWNVERCNYRCTLRWWLQRIHWEFRVQISVWFFFLLQKNSVF